MPVATPAVSPSPGSTAGDIDDDGRHSTGGRRISRFQSRRTSRRISTANSDALAVGGKAASSAYGDFQHLTPA